MALAGLVLALNLAAGIVAANVSSIIRAAPQYQEQLEKILHDLPFGIEIEDVPALSQLTREIDIKPT